MTGVEDPADHAGDGRLAAGAADSDAALRRVQQLGEELRTGEVGEAKLTGADDVGNCLLDRGRGDESHSVLKAGAVLREELDPERAKIVELVRGAAGVERAVGARDLAARSADDGGEGEHAAAANAAEENRRINHGRGPIGRAGEEQAELIRGAMEGAWRRRVGEKAKSRRAAIISYARAERHRFDWCSYDKINTGSFRQPRSCSRVSRFRKAG